MGYGNEELSTYASPFRSTSGYVGGIGYENSNGKIFVSVFESQEIAVERMQIRINNVPCVIEKGTTDELERPWWFSDCVGGQSIYKNQWNTIIEVVIHSTHSCEDKKDLLINTTKELIKRIKQHSSKVSKKSNITR